MLGVLVGSFLPVCHPLNETVKGYGPVDFGDGNRIVGIPFTYLVFFLYLVAVFEIENGSVGNVVGRQGNVCIAVHNTHLCGTPDNYLEGFSRLGHFGQCPEFVNFKCPVVTGNDLTFRGDG